MNTVPRRTGAPEPSAETGLRALLDAIHDALDVPWSACKTADSRDALVARRALVVNVTLDSLHRGQDPARLAGWLRGHIAEHLPLPGRTEDGAQ